MIKMIQKMIIMKNFFSNKKITNLKNPHKLNNKQ